MNCQIETWDSASPASFHFLPNRNNKKEKKKKNLWKIVIGGKKWIYNDNLESKN